MPVIATDMITDFDDVSDDIGDNVVVYMRTQTYDASDYDEGTWTVSGTGQSGITAIAPIGGDDAGEDQKYIEQGLIKLDDKKIFLTGSIDVNENSLIILGTSGTANGYTPVQIIRHEVTGSIVYRTVFIRALTQVIA